MVSLITVGEIPASHGLEWGTLWYISFTPSFNVWKPRKFTADLASAFNMIQHRMIKKWYQLKTVPRNIHLTHGFLSPSSVTTITNTRAVVLVIWIRWCDHNNLELKTSRSKEMVWDFRRAEHTEQSAFFIDGEEGERMESFKGFSWGPHLSWTDLVHKHLSPGGNDRLLTVNTYHVNLQSDHCLIWTSCVQIDYFSFRVHI